MKQIIAFGDSNTWGLNPVLKTRYPENVRWTGILRSRLQHFGLLLKEEGLCGRTTVFEDPHRAGLKGAEDVSRVLSGSPQATAAIVMLGTNDCKKAFHASAEEIGKGLERCLDAFETGIAPERILGISPIVLGENVWRPEKDPDFDSPVTLPDGPVSWRTLPPEKGETVRVLIDRKAPLPPLLLTDYASCGKRWDLEKNRVTVWRSGSTEAGPDGAEKSRG